MPRLSTPRMPASHPTLAKHAAQQAAFARCCAVEPLTEPTYTRPRFVAWAKLRAGTKVQVLL